VTGAADHHGASEQLAAYALGALPAEEGAQLREHLEGCRKCRAELASLRTAVDALPASVPQIEPRPALKESVMAIVESEAALLRAAGETADVPERRERRRRWWSEVSLARPRARLAAAFAVAAITALVLVLPGGGSATRTIQAQVSGPARAAGARVSLQLRGSRAQLVVNGLPAPGANRVDELWVKHGSSAPLPAGTFVVGTGSVVVTRPVRMGDAVLVTVEPGGGSSAPTTVPFIVANA
jgi:anti-sigma-K factor RskA